ncbi:MAG TPA: ribosome-associated translation inhibitor RaiA [Candidatus Limnocylindrales bacterium]|nr:ribosome-associated translation inhibitor RaiA [Candidatus Limnocylindrales bacterium]
MKILIQARDGATDPRIKAYAQAKLEKLARHFDHVLEARLELGTEKKKSVESRKVAELTVHMAGRGGAIRKAVQEAEHVREAIDLVIDKMDRQIRDHKERLKRHRPTAPVEALAPALEPARANGVAKIKRFKLKPMSEGQAQEEMRSLDHSFFVFLNEDSQEVNVLYRRTDGSLGLVETDLT